MSFYLDIAAAVLVPAAALAAAIIRADFLDRRLVHQFLHLADRRIVLLKRRRAIAMEDAVSAFLNTPAGFVVADDPRIIARRELLWSVLESHMRPKIFGRPGDQLEFFSYGQMVWDHRRPAPGTRRRRRAEAALGLEPLHCTV